MIRAASITCASPGILKFMSHNPTEKTETPVGRTTAILKNKKRPLLIASVIVVILLLGLALSGRGKIARHPNIAAFCKAYHMSRGSDDLSNKVQYLRNLEQYAPNDIYPTVHTMRLTYEQAQKQPSNYFGLETGITGSINNFNDYTSSHCSQ